jgi:hypothetical protein
VLLAIAEVETDWRRARQAQPDELVPADIRTAVDAVARLGRLTPAFGTGRA